MLSFHFAVLQSMGSWLSNLFTFGKMDGLGTVVYRGLIALVLFFICRLLYLIVVTHSNDVRILAKQPKGKKMCTMIIIGSGGHTTEILRLVREMTPNLYSPRVYVMASSDSSSEVKIHKAEDILASKTAKRCRKYIIEKIPRSRHVGQSFISSIFTTIYSSLKCLPIMLRHRPELIICNGPGTCIPICCIGFLMRSLFITNTLVVFVESICRVESLSLTGHILYYIADVILVQWPELEQKYHRVAYIGRL